MLSGLSSPSSLQLETMDIVTRHSNFKVVLLVLFLFLILFLELDGDLQQPLCSIRYSKRSESSSLGDLFTISD